MAGFFLKRRHNIGRMREGIIAEVSAADRARLEALAADGIIRWIGPATLQIIMRVAGSLLLALAVQLDILVLRDLDTLAPLPGAGH
jgi:small neutral amino acid transporter SnatA (MarC family)